MRFAGPLDSCHCDFSFGRLWALAPRGVDDFPYCASQLLVSGTGNYLLTPYLYHDERFVMASRLRVILYDDAQLAMYLCGFIAPLFHARCLMV